MKRVSYIQLTILWLSVAWLIVVVAPLINKWAWSGLHPSGPSAEQLDTLTVPLRRLREMDDRFREERNGYLFKLAPVAVVLFVVLYRISTRRDIDGEQSGDPPATHAQD